MKNKILGNKLFKSGKVLIAVAGVSVIMTNAVIPVISTASANTNNVTDKAAAKKAAPKKAAAKKAAAKKAAAKKAAAKKAAAKKAAAKKAAAKKAAAKKAAAKKAAAKKAATDKAAADKAAADKAAADKAAADKAAADKAAADKAAADKAAADKAAADKAAADKAAADKAAADKAAADKAAADKAAADKAAADEAAASSNSESATVDSSSSSETTNPTVYTPFAGKAVHTIYTGTNTYLYTTKELTTIATTPLQGNTSVIAYPDGITTALTGKNAGDQAIPVTYKGQNLYFKGTWGDLTSNGLYTDGYYYALTDTTFYGVVKPTDPSVKLDAPFLNGSTWFYYFDGGVTIYSYKNNVWTGNTFLNAQ
ncbi:histone H1-like repetitive region-containing protein [Lactobacillus delbrueckii subsp. bulgaricus]